MCRPRWPARPHSSRYPTVATVKHLLPKRRVVYVAFAAALACVPGRPSAAQAAHAAGPPLNRDPDAARLVTSDIPRFWRAYDGATLANAAARFQRVYIDSGSAGVHDFVAGRLENGRELAGTVAARPRFYAAIRANTLAIDTARAVTGAVGASFRRVKTLYPDAVFPDVYFVVGRLNSGGTVSDRGLLIGVEINARDANAPTDELNDWERAVTGTAAALPGVVAHELTHMQRRGGDPEHGAATLLARSLNEGAADFIGELISGVRMNPVQHVYGSTCTATHTRPRFGPSSRRQYAARTSVTGSTRATARRGALPTWVTTLATASAKRTTRARGTSTRLCARS